MILWRMNGITPSIYRKCVISMKMFRNVVFFQEPSMDVYGANEGLVVEHAGFNCSAPGCKCFQMESECS